MAQPPTSHFEFDRLSETRNDAAFCSITCRESQFLLVSGGVYRQLPTSHDYKPSLAIINHIITMVFTIIISILTIINVGQPPTSYWALSRDPGSLAFIFRREHP